MGCSCNKSAAAGAGPATPSSFQVKKPDGTIVSYRTKTEAQAAATRTGGRCTNC